MLAFYERLCLAADDALGEPAACNHFLNWYDQTPRPEMRRQLLREVQGTFNHRLVVAA